MGASWSVHPPSRILLNSDGEPILWLGNLDDALNKDWLSQEKIAVILNLSQENAHIKDLPERIKHYEINVPDHPSVRLSDHFEKTNDVLDMAIQSGKPTLVHCQVGKSRSATIVLAYLMKTFRWSLKEALEFVRKRRPIVEPNWGFMKQLQDFEQKIKG